MLNIYTKIYKKNNNKKHIIIVWFVYCIIIENKLSYGNKTNLTLSYITSIDIITLKSVKL